MLALQSSGQCPGCTPPQGPSSNLEPVSHGKNLYSTGPWMDEWTKIWIVDIGMVVV